MERKCGEFYWTFIARPYFLPSLALTLVLLTLFAPYFNGVIRRKLYGQEAELKLKETNVDTLLVCQCGHLNSYNSTTTFLLE